ncbi:hypothetical protein [uncultured Methanobrevibacter sp.]|uniref:hypothetical protein n=1 Tax=uncultured Methanobrevibacter sp. TaxID=253161 RepID=UPI0025F468A7|nr:hypothetical protein [uncultured Methanobrevibacter sp.]
MSLLFEDKEAPKRLGKKETFNVPLDIIIYGSLICGSGILLMSVFMGMFVAGV